MNATGGNDATAHHPTFERSPTMSTSTALSRALDGKPVAESSAPKALTEAVEKINKLKEAGLRMKENAGTTAEAGINAVETLVVLGASGVAEGYFGREKMKLGKKVPIRGTAGVLLTGWGLLNTLNGKSGNHQLALGVGLMGAETYSMGQEAGEALRQKKDQAAANQGAPAPTAAQQALLSANPGAKLLNGKVVNAQGVALEGADDMTDLARLVRMQSGTEGDRRAPVPARALPAGAPRRRAQFGIG